MLKSRVRTYSAIFSCVERVSYCMQKLSPGTLANKRHRLLVTIDEISVRFQFATCEFAMKDHRFIHKTALVLEVCSVKASQTLSRNDPVHLSLCFGPSLCRDGMPYRGTQREPTTASVTKRQLHQSPLANIASSQLRIPPRLGLDRRRSRPQPHHAHIRASRRRYPYPVHLQHDIRG